MLPLAPPGVREPAATAKVVEACATGHALRREVPVLVPVEASWQIARALWGALLGAQNTYAL